MNIKTIWLKGLRRNTIFTIWFTYETTESVESAIKREKQIKRWKRDWKIRLIEKKNAEWKDLFYGLF